MTARRIVCALELVLLAGPALAAGGGGDGDGGEGAGGEGAGAGSSYIRVRPVVISFLAEGELGAKMSAAFMLEPHDAQAIQRQVHDAVSVFLVQ